MEFYNFCLNRAICHIVDWPLTPGKELPQRTFAFRGRHREGSLVFHTGFLQLGPMSQKLREFVTWREMGWEVKAVG